ncbi:MAG: FKBP-type peptidyl-prolyl cis-trans isomerase [Ferruginibacter sp.]|nr:hypothetical protein [Ferruginibacter sp.]
MQQKLLFTLIFISFFACTNAQYKSLQNGLEYRYIKKGKTTQTGKVGDFIGMILRNTCGNQVLFDTKKYNKGTDSPVNFPIAKSKSNYDINDVLQLLHEGDSVIVRIPQDSFYRGLPQAQRKGLKAGEPVMYYIGVHSIKTAAQFKKIQDDYKKSLAAFAKQQAEFKKQQQAQLLLQKQQLIIDKNQDEELKKYFAKNNINNVTKLPSGIYTIIEKEGKGDFIKPGVEVTMNYEKQSLSGKKYDSNIDTIFKNTTALKANIGQRKLLAGWEEGLQKFNKGAKGQIFIPSKLAYGNNKFGVRPNDTIPANTILKIDVEVLDVIDLAVVAKQLAEKQDSDIQTFLKTNNLTATKTNSGMYYIITRDGTGEKPAVGTEVTMNYTGMFLDGKKFDSNEDSTFNHVSPFKFTLGKGQVIKGWDEGVALLQKGTKAKFILPSSMAYGANGTGGIPANSILQFDVELVDFKNVVAVSK